MADWKIRRRLGACTRCETEFADGDRHSSLLRLDDEHDLVREDLCPACFSAGDSESYLFWWFTRFQEQRSKSLNLDLASLERLFMELDGREEGKLRELRYLLCLLLMRKRKLKLQKVKRGKDGEVLVLRRPRRQEELEVWVYDFTPDRMEEMRTRLQEVLEGSGPGDESASAAEQPESPIEDGEDLEVEASLDEEDVELADSSDENDAEEEAGEKLAADVSVAQASVAEGVGEEVL